MVEELAKKYIKEELDSSFNDNQKSVLKCLEEHLNEYIKDKGELKRTIVFIKGLIRMGNAYDDILCYELYELSNKLSNEGKSE